tara:strand:+ start:1456 stop:1677 length:222 start_codon:yes stop_codon:yes gene_type:complete
MTTREEATKMRKELVRAERILAQKEKARESKPDFTPMTLKNNEPRPEATTNSTPNVIHLPSKKQPKHENRPFY